METGEAVLGAIRNGVEDMRLIDADALNLEYEVDMADDWKTAHEIANVVKYAPTIDAVKVTRCKHCEHYRPITARCMVRGENAPLIRGENDFCSRAKPKGGDPE